MQKSIWSLCEMKWLLGALWGGMRLYGFPIVLNQIPMSFLMKLVEEFQMKPNIEKDKLNKVLFGSGLGYSFPFAHETFFR